VEGLYKKFAKGAVSLNDAAPFITYCYEAFRLLHDAVAQVTNRGVTFAPIAGEVEPATLMESVVLLVFAFLFREIHQKAEREVA